MITLMKRICERSRVSMGGGKEGGGERRTCIALSGLGRPSAVERVIRERAATAVESWKQRKF